MNIRAKLVEICDAFNAHDLDRIMSSFADDCVLEMPPIGGTNKTRHCEAAANVWPTVP